jgi:hypothetical protein
MFFLTSLSSPHFKKTARHFITFWLTDIEYKKCGMHKNINIIKLVIFNEMRFNTGGPRMIQDENPYPLFTTSMILST